MKKSILFLSWIILALIISHQMIVYAQPQLYTFPEVEDSKDKAEVKNSVDPFIKAMAKKTSSPEDILSESAKKGMGRLELIRLILISKKSGKPLPEIIQTREKSTRFAKISKDVGVDNATIKKEAKEILKELVSENQSPKPMVAGSTMTTGNDFEVTESTAAAEAEDPDQEAE